jgi:hypothetical protein
MSLCEQASTRDFNRDGKSEELHVSVRMPLACDEIITGASLIAFLDVSLAVRTVVCVFVRACFLFACNATNVFVYHVCRVQQERIWTRWCESKARQPPALHPCWWMAISGLGNGACGL